MSTTSSIEEVNSTRRRFRITVAQDAVKTAFKSAVSQVQGTAEVKGFRKGKVPENIVRKFFENDVRKKAYENIIEASYQETIKNAEFQIVSFPMIEVEGQFQEAGDFIYTATVDINPQVEIGGYKELTLKATGEDPNIDDQVEKTISQVAKENGKVNADTTGRAAQKGDLVRIDYTLSLEGKELKDRARDGTRLELDGTNFADLENGIVGMKPTDAKKFTVKFPADHRDAELQSKDVEFHVTLKEISTIEPAVLDDEFVTRFGASNLEEFKRSVRESLANINEKTRVAQFKDQIMTQVLEKNNFEVPESLVEGTVDRAIAEANGNRDKKAQLDTANEEVRSQYREWALNEVRGVLALGHIARTEGLTVDDKEVGQEMAQFAAQTNTRIQDIVKQYGAQIIEEFRGKVLIDKVIKHLIGLNKIERA